MFVDFSSLILSHFANEADNSGIARGATNLVSIYVYICTYILLRNLFGWKFTNNTDQKTEEILKIKRGTTDLNPIAWVEGTGPISYSG